MSSGESGDVTALLQRLEGGNDQALAEVFRLVYAELRALARRQLGRERPDHTLQPTALVHEAFLRLVGQHSSFESRQHFFTIAALAMRRILVDHARARRAARRGGGAAPVPLSQAEAGVGPSDEEILGVDEALEGLARLAPRQARVVELRFFAGLTLEETADLLGVSVATVKRDWLVARAWLQRELDGTAG